MFLDKEEKDIFGALLQVNSQEAQATRSGEEEGKDQRPQKWHKNANKGGKGPSQSAASWHNWRRQDNERADNQLKDMMRITAQLVTRHEDAISILRADKSMLLFMKTQGQESFLPAMYQISQEWKKNKDSGGKVKSPLRIVLLKCYLSEMTARLEKANKDPDTRAAVLKAAWAVESSGELLWNFQQYDKEKQEELVDPSLKPIPHAKILENLQKIAACITPDVVQRFHATRPMASQYTGAVVVFMLEVAHRGDPSNILYDAMMELVNNRVWNLMASRMRQDSMGRSPLANRLSQMLAGQSGASNCSMEGISATRTPW